MANDQDLLVSNTAPDRKDMDRNVTVDVYVCPVSFSAVHTSTTGIRRLGSLDIGSYDMKTTTTNNKTQLGGNKRTVNTHINGTEAQLMGKFNEITPFGLLRKNPATVNLLLSLSATLYTTTAVALMSLSFSTVSGLAVGAFLEIPYSTNEVNYDYRYIDDINSLSVHLLTDLDETPAVGVAVREVLRYNTRVGGDRVRKDTAIVRISGDDGMVMFHEVPEIQYQNGQMSAPKDAISLLSISAEVIGKSRAMDGSVQTSLFDEITYPNVAALSGF